MIIGLNAALGKVQARPLLGPFTWVQGRRPGRLPRLADAQCAAGMPPNPSWLHGFHSHSPLLPFLASQRMDLAPGAPLARDAPRQLPLVLFSHGLGGNRFL